MVLLHACGKVSLLSPKGVELGLYSGRYSGSWLFNNIIYLGSDTLQSFDPSKPNVTMAVTGLVIIIILIIDLKESPCLGNPNCCRGSAHPGPVQLAGQLKLGLA